MNSFFLLALLALSVIDSNLAGTTPSDAAWLKAKAKENVSSGEILFAFIFNVDLMWTFFQSRT